MSRVNWDEDGKRLFETGVDRGVYYKKDTNGAYVAGEAWNGLTGVTESPSGGEAEDVYADNIKYLNLMSKEEYGATITAYTYPDGFAEANGEAEVAPGVTANQQTRKPFGFSYRTLIGNDIDSTDHGYKIHLVYGAKASPSEQSHSTMNDTPEAEEMSWEVNTVPVNVTGFKPTAHFVVNSLKTTAEKLAAFEDILYGTADTDATMPLPDAVIAHFADSASYRVVTPTGTENPSTEGWYEKNGDNYVLSTDTTVDSSKTYYEKVVG